MSCALQADPDYMHERCPASCATCPYKQRARPGNSSSTTALTGAMGVVGLGVRAGQIVDALRVRCGVNAPVAKPKPEGEGTGEGEGEGAGAAAEAAEEASAISPWFGGHGGRECWLSADGNEPLHRLVVKAGHLVDRLELPSPSASAVESHSNT